MVTREGSGSTLCRDYKSGLEAGCRKGQENSEEEQWCDTYLTENLLNCLICGDSNFLHTEVEKRGKFLSALKSHV